MAIFSSPETLSIPQDIAPTELYYLCLPPSSYHLVVILLIGMICILWLLWYVLDRNDRTQERYLRIRRKFLELNPSQRVFVDRLEFEPEHEVL